jgi:hypothetical protein
MTKPYIHSEMTYLDESSQRELAAYRKLGSVRQLRLLKHREYQRRYRYMRVCLLLNKILAAATFGACLVSILFIVAILA